MGFPEIQAKARKATAAANTHLTESSGVFQRSIQGIRPLLLNVYRYHATYPMDSPTTPTTPVENPVSSQGPLGATPNTRESRIRSAEAIAREIHAGALLSSTNCRGRAVVMMYCSSLRGPSEHVQYSLL